MDLLEDARADDCVQVRLHEIEDQVQVFVILRLDHVEQRDDVLVAVQLLEEHDLSQGESYLAESALGVRGVMKGIEHLLEGDHLFGLFVDCLPHNTVGSFAQLLQDIELLEDMGLNFFSHRLIFVC